MTGFPFRLVTVDIDGTLTRVHGWRVIARAFGREADFEASNRRFFAHETSEDEHLRALVNLAIGRSVREVETVLAATPLVTDIADSIVELHRLGAHVAVLSHNPSYVCDWYRRTFGFDDAEGMDGAWVRNGQVVDGGLVRADKLSGLRRLEARFGVAPPEVVHIGDGWADAALFPHVGAGVAFNSHLPDVERSADAALHAESFSALLPVLERLAPRRGMNADPPSAHSSNTSNRV
jgi:phosphoserine phosphatase